jgi:putative flippase GtrA
MLKRTIVWCRAHWREILRYLVFGGLTTLVNYIVFFGAEALVKPLLGKESYWVSNPAAWVAAVAFAYVTNKLFVFRQKSWEGRLVRKELGSFVAARLVSLGLEQGLMFVFYTLLLPAALRLLAPLQVGEDLYKALVKIFLLQGMVVILNYIFSKLVIFRKK